MPIENHIKALHEKHAVLQTMVDNEERRLAPDNLLIQNLKRQKLQIKDKIAAIPNAEIAPFPARSPAATSPSAACPLRMAG